MSAFSTCAKCNQAIHLHSSLASGLQHSQFDMIASHFAAETAPAMTAAQLARMPLAVQNAYRNQQAKAPALSRRTVPPNRVSKGPAESFIVLGESQAKLPSKNASTDARPSAQRLALTQKLFTLMSSHSDVDHPLCIDCADLVQDMMSKQLEEVKRDRDRYINFEKSVNGIKYTDQDVAKLKAEIEHLKMEEITAMQQLREAEEEEVALNQQLKELELEDDELKLEEERFWNDYSVYTTHLHNLKSQYQSLQAQYNHDARELEKLQKTNVYNDAFCIGHEGGLATINGLRLGRLPSVAVDWPEINAAWGHTIMLLQTLARKWNHTFETYRLIPMASFSKLERIEDKTIMELYGSGEFAFGRILLNRRFDHAMVAFLECLRQIMEVALKREPNLRLPFSVNKDKIGEVSIKLQFSTDTAWTRALRHVLLTMKLLSARLDDAEFKPA